VGVLGRKASEAMGRYCNCNRRTLWLGACTIFLAVIVLVFICIREMDREFRRVAPEESAAVAWIAEKGGSIAKEGKQRHVVSVNLGGTSVSDSELERLRELTRLRELDLSGTPITDAGLRALAPLKELEYIDVSHICNAL